MTESRPYRHNPKQHLLSIKNNGHLAADFMLESSKGVERFGHEKNDALAAFQAPSDIASNSSFSFFAFVVQPQSCSLAFRFKTLAGDEGKVIFIMTDQGISRQMLFPWINPEAFRA